MNDRVIVCTYEDRPAAMPGVELLARSLQRHSPDAMLTLFSPLDPAASTGLAPGQVDWIRTDELRGKGWNVKPAILLKALRMGDTALWLDTDIIMTGDVRRLIDQVPEDHLAVGQEFRSSGHGGTVRARSWGFPVGRQLPYHVNSGSVLVRPRHRALLERWQALLDDDGYQAAQRRPVADRPLHQLGDQDLLWALLVSEEFADLPLWFYRCGIDVIQDSGANGYHVVERIGHVTNSDVVFVHFLGRTKPWSFAMRPEPRRDLRAYTRLAAYELSPYFAEASRYAAAMGYPAWLSQRTMLAKGMTRILRTVPLRGMPFALAAWSADGFRKIAGK